MKKRRMGGTVVGRAAGFESFLSPSSDARTLLAPLGHGPPPVRALSTLLTEYVALRGAARGRAALAAAHPVLGQVLSALDRAAGVEGEEATVVGVVESRQQAAVEPWRPPAPARAHPAASHASPSPAPSTSWQHATATHDATAALRSPRRLLRKRQAPARRPAPPPPPPSHDCALDDLLDMPLNMDGLMSFLADDAAAERLAASLAPRLAAAGVEGGGGSGGGADRAHHHRSSWAAALAADPEVATLLVPLVGGGHAGSSARPPLPPPPHHRPASMPPPPPRPPAGADEASLEAFLGGLRYD